MNEILRDMINQGKVAAFVDGVLMGTETEEEHDKIVDEVLRRLEENDLYVKPEKCVWKARKVPFLGVVMGEGRVEMEEDKVEGCHKLPLWLSPFLLFFSLLFYFLFIAWESLSHYVTQGHLVVRESSTQTK